MSDYIKERWAWLQYAKKNLNLSSPDYEELKTRRTGKSTGKALALIGEALQNPGKSIAIKDTEEVPDTLPIRMNQLSLIEDLVKKLELDGFRFHITSFTLTYDLIPQEVRRKQDLDQEAEDLLK